MRRAPVLMLLALAAGALLILGGVINAQAAAMAGISLKDQPDLDTRPGRLRISRQTAPAMRCASASDNSGGLPDTRTCPSKCSIRAFSVRQPEQDARWPSQSRSTRGFVNSPRTSSINVSLWLRHVCMSILLSCLEVVS